MSHFFLDTSAVLKRYKTEIGSAWVRALVVPAMKNTVILSEITLAEVAAALAAAHRAPGGFTIQERDNALGLFLKHCAAEYSLVAVNRALVDRAVSLTQRHKLRGCDSLQLAAALTASEQVLAAGLAPLTFVAADDDLIAAAGAEGIPTENPNHHP